MKSSLRLPDYSFLKKSFVLVCSQFLCVSAFTQTVNYEWAKQIGGGNYESSNANTTDAAGNVYSVGSFSGTVDFNPATGGGNIYNLTAAGGTDAYILKLDASGNFLWAFSFGNSDDDYLSSVTVDSAGNVITTGAFSGSADVDPDTSAVTINSYSSDVDVCLISFSPGGQLNWAQVIGGPDADAGTCVVYHNNRILIGGYYKSTVDFNTGPGTNSKNSNGGTDGFILSLDTAGMFIWVAVFGDADNDFVNAIDCNSSNDIYSTGFFEGVVDFDPGASAEMVTSAGDRDAFVWRLDWNGNYIAISTLGGASIDTGNDLAVDDDGNTYVTGDFYGSMDADPLFGTYNLTDASSGGAFVVKLRSLGEFVWAYSLGGTNNDNGQAICLGNDGMLYMAFLFQGTIDVDPGVAVLNSTSNGQYDFLLLKTDTSSQIQWSFSTGSTWNDLAYGLSLHGDDIIISGEFKLTVDFNPNAGTNNLTSPSIINNDGFVARYTQVPVSVTDSPLQLHSFRLFPNPTSQVTTLDVGTLTKPGVVLIKNAMGMVIKKTVLTGLRYNEIDLGDMSTGIYYVTVVFNDGQSNTLRLVKTEK